MLIIDLVKNVALLVALVVAYQVAMSRKRRDMPSGKILFGVLLGLTGVAVMMTPVDYGNGIISIAGPFCCLSAGCLAGRWSPQSALCLWWRIASGWAAGACG